MGRAKTRISSVAKYSRGPRGAGGPSPRASGPVAREVSRHEQDVAVDLRVSTPARPSNACLQAMPPLPEEMDASQLRVLVRNADGQGAAARYLFDVPVRGPLWALFAATLIYLLGALGFADLLDDNLFGCLCGDAAEINRRQGLGQKIANFSIRI